MSRSNSAKHAKPRFGRHVTTIGARQQGEDMRRERARTIALIAQTGGTPASQMRIFARRLAQGKRV